MRIGRKPGLLALNAQDLLEVCAYKGYNVLWRDFMFDVNAELKQFKPIDLSSIRQKLGQIPEDMQNAIELYNKALEDVAGKNDDMAIIALKKAISIYPAFYEAMNLMGVLYESLGDEESARYMFNKVIEMDDSSIRAQQYLHMLDGKDDGRAAGGKKREKNPVVSWLSRGLSPEKTTPFYLKYILGFVIGVIAMGVLWLLMPADKPLIQISPKTDSSQQIQALKDENDRLNQVIDELRASLEQSNQKEKSLRDELEQYQAWSRTLRQLDSLAAAGKYRDLVVEVERLEGMPIPAEIEQEIMLLYESSKPKAIGQIYESAKSIYDSNANNKSKDVYKQSADEFKMAIRIIEELDDANKPNNTILIYYYGAKAIALSEYPSKDEAIQEALDIFNMIIENYPNSEYARYSRLRINEIESGRPVKH